jgi:hypothetical protein
VIIDDRRAFKCDLRKVGEIRREGRRKYRITFDNSGIAIGCALTRALPIDQRDRQTALGEMDSNGGADDTRAEHHDIRARQKDLRPSSLRENAQQGASAV